MLKSIILLGLVVGAFSTMAAPAAASMCLLGGDAWMRQAIRESPLVFIGTKVNDDSSTSQSTYQVETVLKSHGPPPTRITLQEIRFGGNAAPGERIGIVTDLWEGNLRTSPCQQYDPANLQRFMERTRSWLPWLSAILLAATVLVGAAAAPRIAAPPDSS
ncbi:MAG: hypothetical protein ABIS18_11200 [Actinomycetota bacterium]